MFPDPLHCLVKDQERTSWRQGPRSYAFVQCKKIAFSQGLSWDQNLHLQKREFISKQKPESMCPCHGIHWPYCVPWHPETAALVTQWDGSWRLSYHSGWVAALRAACMLFYKMWIRPEPVTNIWCCLFHSQNTGVLTPKKCGISHYNHQISLTVFTYLCYWTWVLVPATPKTILERQVLIGMELLYSGGQQLKENVD